VESALRSQILVLFNELNEEQHFAGKDPVYNASQLGVKNADEWN